MVDFEQVAKLPLKDLTEAADAAVTIDPTKTMQDAANAIGSAPTHALVVTENDRILGLLTQADISKAIGAGKPSDVPVRDILHVGPPITVSDDMTLEELPGQIGPSSHLVVVDQNGMPSAVVDRQQLAERILKLR